MSDDDTPNEDGPWDFDRLKETLISLTLWEKDFSAQMRERCLILFVYTDEDHTEGVQIEADLDAARHLRDLLNMATARGFL